MAERQAFNLCGRGFDPRIAYFLHLPSEHDLANIFLDSHRASRSPFGGNRGLSTYDVLALDQDPLILVDANPLENTPAQLVRAVVHPPSPPSPLLWLFCLTQGWT